MTVEMALVALTWGGRRIPVQQVDGAREALAELLGECPQFQPHDPKRGLWLVERSAFGPFPVQFIESIRFQLTTEI